MNDVTKLFEETLYELRCQEETRSYIVGIYSKFRFANTDLSQDSITINYLNARHNLDFNRFQQLGDWLFFSMTLAPAHLKHASEDYYRYVCRDSYYYCFKLINKEWLLFEELSDNLFEIEKETIKLLNKKNISL